MNPAEHITLNFPIEHDGLPIQEIALRRPTVVFVRDLLIARAEGREQATPFMPHVRNNVTV